MPRIRQGKNLPRRERPFQSRQRTVSRASFDTQIIPDPLALVLTGFAPTVATPVVVTPATVTLALTGFAPAVATPRVVTPGKASLTLTGFAPTVATPRLVTPGVATLRLTTFAPVVTATANVAASPSRGGGFVFIRKPNHETEDTLFLLLTIGEITDEEYVTLLAA